MIKFILLLGMSIADSTTANPTEDPTLFQIKGPGVSISLQPDVIPSENSSVQEKPNPPMFPFRHSPFFKTGMPSPFGLFDDFDFDSIVNCELFGTSIEDLKKTYKEEDGWVVDMAEREDLGDGKTKIVFHAHRTESDGNKTQSVSYERIVDSASNEVVERTKADN